MKLVGFWILESVIDEGEWDSSRVRIFDSYEKMIEFCREVVTEGDPTSSMEIITVSDEYSEYEPYFRQIVIDSEMPNDPYYVIHKGSLVVE